MFQLSLQQVPPAERNQLDLSCLEQLWISGERINGSLLESFFAYFEPAGLHRQAIRVAYGLTETISPCSASTGLVHFAYSQKQLQQNRALRVAAEAPDAIDLVSCGEPKIAQCVVVDPETQVPCAEKQVGEIWASGPNISGGYWRQPELTQETFQARLAGSDEGPFLRTGDLGFFEEGQLYITGRLKDIIILRGQNFYAPDFEQVVAGRTPRWRWMGRRRWGFPG